MTSEDIKKMIPTIERAFSKALVAFADEIAVIEEEQFKAQVSAINEVHYELLEDGMVVSINSVFLEIDEDTQNCLENIIKDLQEDYPDKKLTIREIPDPNLS